MRDQSLQTRRDPRDEDDDDVTRDAREESIDPSVVDRPPSAVGHYEILDRLGAGGMGAVYTAYDSRLERRVALKLLHPELEARDGDPGVQARTRLLREARAIAQVKHPNVIHVYDVGVVELRQREQVFVAMELVEGQSLRRWIESLRGSEAWARGQALSQIVEVMAQAGRGLAAAHRAGLVHRDFKPDNALLGDDGLVRVVDFGLARRADAREDSETASPAAMLESQTASGSLDERLTKTGAAMGTPAYMAPEQMRGEPVDGRTDQFAFCLTLFEALYGRSAFPHRGRARVIAVLDGDRRPYPDKPPVPAYLRAVLDRGLSGDPGARFPSMDALLEALLDDPSRRRRERLRWLSAGGLVAATAAVVIATRPEPVPEPDVCGHGATRIDAVWNPASAEAVDRALRVQSLPYGEHIATAAGRALDDYAEAWGGAHRQACEATHVHHEQTGAVLDLRMACLDRRLAAFEVSVELLAAAQPEQVEHALSVTQGLPSLDACADRAALEAVGPAPPDEDERESVLEVHAQLERAAALGRLLRVEEALAIVDAQAPQVEAIEHPPLEAEFRYARGHALVVASRFEDGETVLRSALMRAQALGMDPVVRDAAADLAEVLGSQLARPAEAIPWIDLAEATDERIGSTPATKASLLKIRAWVLVAWGEKPQAVEVIGQALEQALEAYAPDDFQMISFYANRGIVYAQLRQLDEALPHFRRAVELTEQHMGLDHPALLANYRNLGNALSAMRRTEEAERYLQKAARLVERIPGVNAKEEALIASALGNQAMARKDWEPALEHHRRALELREQIYGAEHPMVGRSLNNMAGATRELGNTDEAIELYQRSLAIREASVGAEHPSLTYPLGNLGVLLMEHGRAQEALPFLERADVLLEEHGDVPTRHAEHYFWLGRALIETKKDPKRGMALIERSRARQLELGVQAKVDEVDQWLEQHRKR